MVLLAAGLFVAFGTNVLTPSHPTPNVVNLPLAQARAALDKVHMNLKEGVPVKSIPVTAGDVVSQSPKSGVSQKEGSTVTVVVSAGPPDVSVPSLANMTCAQAVTALQSVHLQADCTPGSYDNNVPATIIISWSVGSAQNPTKAPYGSTITIVPSLGHQPATVPSIPTTYTYAQAAGRGRGGRPDGDAGQRGERHGAVGQRDLDQPRPVGRAGALRLPGHGQRVDRAADDQVPNVQGDTVQQATAALQGAGLNPSGVRATRRGPSSAPSPPSARRCRRARRSSSSRSSFRGTAVALPFDPSL